MLNREAVATDQSLVSPAMSPHQAIEISQTLPVRLQKFDMDRHVAVAPDGRRYIVATFDDRHMGRGYVTAIYPQQGGYLTLLRLVLCELSSETPEEAREQHRSCVQTVQEGKLSEFVKSLRA